ncbi:MAG: class I SAM-dependent methyltransferase [Myxococcales bacterium]|nr:class I SAM-dependent methyltransferase [Myxococcales bacterium]
MRGQRLQAQTQALILEALGPCDGLRTLDAGCGWGRLTLALATLGARAVGNDLIDATIEALRREHPGVTWVAGSFLDPAVLAPHGPFDRILAVESFQCAGPPESSLHALWSHLAPGGRLVAVMPNAACPIVQRAVASLAGNLWAITPEAMQAELAALPGLARYAMRGLSFGADQWVSPYEVSPWAADAAAWPLANRMMIVVERRSA